MGYDSRTRSIASLRGSKLRDVFFCSQSAIAVLVKRLHSNRALGAIGHGGPRAGSLGMTPESFLSVNAKTVFARVVIPSANSLTASRFMGRPSVEDNPTLFHYGKGRNSRQRSTLRTCVRASSCSGGLYITKLLGSMISL